MTRSYLDVLRAFDPTPPDPRAWPCDCMTGACCEVCEACPCEAEVHEYQAPGPNDEPPYRAGRYCESHVPEGWERVD